LNEREIQFKWNDVKATQNLRKHGVSFDLARTVFADRHILTVADLEHSEAEERWLSIGSASNGAVLSVVYLWRENEHMTNVPEQDDELPAEIDFSKGVRGLHYITPDAKVLVPTSIERGVWDYFSGKAKQRGVELPDLLTEVLKRDIEINEALK